MAGQVYKNCALLIDAVDVGPQLNLIEIRESRQEISWDLFQAEDSNQDVGPLKTQIHVTGVYTAGGTEAAKTFGALIKSGESAAVTLHPDGATAGDEEITGTIYVSARNASLPRGTQGTIDVTLIVNGPLTEGVVAGT